MSNYKHTSMLMTEHEQVMDQISQQGRDALLAEIRQLKVQNDELITALNEILRVTPMGVEAFSIAALVLGELGVSKEAQS